MSAWTVTGKDDGFGAQLMAKLSGIAYCRRHGIPYVHTPIRHLLPVGTFATDMEDQVDAANAFIRPIMSRLGLDRPLPIERSVEHMHDEINRDPDGYYTPEFTRLLAGAYPHARPGLYAGAGAKVAVHVRRGDVDPTSRERWVELEDISIQMDRLRGLHRDAHFHVFAWKDPCEALAAPDVTLHCSESGKDFLHDFNCFVHADVLVIGASCLSLAAALFNPNRIVAPTQNRERTDWAHHAIPSRWYHDGTGEGESASSDPDPAGIDAQSAVLARTSSAGRIARALSEKGIARDRIGSDLLESFYRGLRRIAPAPRMEGVDELLPDRGSSVASHEPVWGVIVETRAHPALEYAVRNVSTTLGIPVQIFHGAETADFILSTSIADQVADGRVVLTPLRAERLGPSQYNALLLSLGFWERVRASRKVFLFQADGLVCPRSPYSIEDFLDFDYIGSSWARRRPIGMVADGGSGGVTLRDKEVTMQCLRRFPPDSWPGGEDGYYAFHLDLMGARIGRGVECERFCTQGSFRESSLCCHKPSLLGRKDRERFLAYCPEAMPLLER